MGIFVPDMHQEIATSNICILGAGPAGAAAALYLHHNGYNCTLIDKAVFPRDKVCGDALSGKVINILRRINPALLDNFYNNLPKSDVWGIRFVAPNNCMIEVPLKIGYTKNKEVSPGFVSKRFDFDNFLVEEVRNCSKIDFKEGLEIGDIHKSKKGYVLKDKLGNVVIQTRLLLVANGANSRFSRMNAGLEKEDKHLAAGVKAYFKNVEEFHEDGFIELHFLDSLVPGYFWLFSLPNGEANIGLGLRADYLKKKKLKLRETILDIIKNDSFLKSRFKNASICGPIEGYPLPLGSKLKNLSGDHYMLLGDAGHLIDPLTGEGIGNGMYSGWIAAEQAIECLKRERFDKSFMNAYDIRIKRVLGSELKLSYTLQRIMVHKWLINFLANRLHNSYRLREILTKMYVDLELRKKLISPLFWFKLVLNIK